MGLVRAVAARSPNLRPPISFIAPQGEGMSDWGKECKGLLDKEGLRGQLKNKTKNKKNCAVFSVSEQPMVSPSAWPSLTRLRVGPWQAETRVIHCAFPSLSHSSELELSLSQLAKLPEGCQCPRLAALISGRLMRTATVLCCRPKGTSS